VIVAKGKYLDHMGMIDRSGDSGFLLQLIGVFRPQIFAQKFQCYISVQLGVARFVNRPHSAGTKGLAQLEMIKRARDPYSLATGRTGHAREGFGIADIYRRIALGTRNGVRVAHFCDSNIVNDTGKPP
jgi:hypothetical protein